MVLKRLFIACMFYAMVASAPCSADTLKHSEQQQKELDQTKSTTIVGANLDGATELGVIRWNLNKMPLRVFIKPGTGIPGCHDNLASDLKQCFEEWASVSNGKIQFTFSDDISTSDIRCCWTDDPNLIMTKTELGQCHLAISREGIAKADIILLTVSLVDKKPLSPEELHAAALHEIGHALGWSGHSLDPASVMFARLHGSAQVTARDAAVLARLYLEPISIPSESTVLSKNVNQEGFANSLKNNPFSSNIHERCRLNNEAGAAMDKHDWALAIQKYDQALALDSTYELARENLMAAIHNSYVDHDYQSAMPYLKKLAAQRNTEAEKDLTQAKKWLSKAAAQGHKDAQEALDSL